VLNRIAPWTQWLFSRPAVVIWGMVCLYAISLAIDHWSELVQSSAVLLDRDNWLRLIMVWFFLKILHETGHALACLRFGGAVPSVGLLLILFTPLPVSYMTASWRFPSKWQRIATAAAGMYVELFIGAVALIIWSHSLNPVTQHLALNVAATASVGSLIFNGNPLMRFDGYYILSDWLELPNLSSSGQRFLARLFQQILGIDPPQDNRPLRTRRIIAIYAVASLLWRGLIYVSLLLLLYAMVSRIGAFVGFLVVLFTVSAILMRPVSGISRFLRKQPALSRRRLGLVAVGALGCGALLVFFLTRPSTIRSWGVVEYSPPTIVRSVSPGFVREVNVRDGQTVQSGQVIAVLENEELKMELADLRKQIEQSLIRERMYQRDEDTPMAQAEAAKCRSLKKKEAEIQKLVEGLTVRAPLEGHVVARNLTSLPGQYLETGDEVVVIGDEEHKEIILAVAQDEIRSFMAQRNRPVTIRISGDESNPLTACLTEIEPRASKESPHPALGADTGGALPVRTKRESSSSKSVENELLDSYFTGTIELTPSQSLKLYSGQRATIVFGSAEQSWAGQLLKSVCKWVNARLASARPES